MTGGNETNVSDHDSDWTDLDDGTNLSDHDDIHVDEFNRIFNTRYPRDPGAATGSADPNPHSLPKNPHSLPKRAWHSLITEDNNLDHNVQPNGEPVWTEDDMLDELVRMDQQTFDLLSMDDLAKCGVEKPEWVWEQMTEEEQQRYIAMRPRFGLGKKQDLSGIFSDSETSDKNKYDRLTDTQRIQAYTLLQVRKELMNNKDIVTITKSKKARLKFKKSYMTWGHNMKLIDIRKRLGGDAVISKGRISQMVKEIDADDFDIETVNSRAKKHGNDRRQLSPEHESEIATMAMYWKKLYGFITIPAFAQDPDNTELLKKRDVRSVSPKRKSDGTFRNNLELGEQQVSSHQLRYIFSHLCYDVNPRFPWCFRHPTRASVYNPKVVQARLDFAHWIWLEHPDTLHNVHWCLHNLLYLDPVHYVLHTSSRSFRFNRPIGTNERAWMSKDALWEQINAARSEFHGQKSTGDDKVSWMQMLCRGKLYIDPLPKGFQETAESVAHWIEHKLPVFISKILETDSSPVKLWTDRSPAFFNTVNGVINARFKSALQTIGVEHIFGDDASNFPGMSADVHPHETTVSWTKYHLRKNAKFRWSGDLASYQVLASAGGLADKQAELKKLGRESREDFIEKRLQPVIDFINETKKDSVVAACKCLPKRVDQLIERGGNKLRS